MRLHPVQALTDAQRATAAATLTAAFAADPAMMWMFPSAAERPERLRRLFDWFLRTHLRDGVVLGSPDAQAVTIWTLPGGIHPHPLSEWLHLGEVLRVFGLGVWRADLLNRALLKCLPAGEGWHYLRMAGVAPDRQGQGLGGATIRAGIRQANAAGLPTCLETFNPGNVALYEALGFRVHATGAVPFGGPPFWTMVRPADAVAAAPAALA